MNRPFYAVGLLLAALGAALVAVQSTSKRPATQPAASSGTLILPPARHHSSLAANSDRGRVFVFVLPECGEIAEIPCFESGCGLDRATGEIYPNPSRRMHTVPEVARSSSTDEPDGRTQYDADYDLAVYGLASVFRVRELPNVDPEAELLEELDPSLRLMRDLIRERGLQPRRPRVRRNRLAEVVLPAESLRAQVPTWEDYEEWIASRQDVAESHGPAQGTAALPAQNGRWMKQFAADALSRLADLLQSAASELERSATEEIAKGKSSSIPK